MTESVATWRQDDEDFSDIVTQYDGFTLHEMYAGFAAEVEFPEGVTKFRGRHAWKEARDYVEWTLERMKKDDDHKAKH